MPFLVTSNSLNLDLTWQNDNNNQRINIQDIKEDYSYINVKGLQNNVFEEFTILNRTQLLQLSECTLDLSQVKGNIGNISISDCLCINDFTDSLTCNVLNIHNSRIKVSQLYKMQLHYLNFSIRSEMCFDFYNFYQLKCILYHLQLTGVNVNLSKLSGEWKSILFTNCTFIGEINNNLFKASVATVQIHQNNQQNNNEVDLSALCGFYTNLNIYLTKVQPDFRSIKLCKPKFLSLRGCNVDIQQMVGEWKSVNISQCTVSNSQSSVPLSSIITNSLVFTDFNYDYAPYIISNYMQISNSKLIEQFPNVKKLYMINSSINISTLNNSIQQLIFFNPKFIRFSVLNLNALIAIDLNFIKEDSPSFKTRNAIINYIRLKKAFKNKSKQRLHRIQYEQNLIQNVLNRIQVLQKHLNAFSNSFDLNGRE
ncbi:Hypothetical_protein [Hexamita inflata]|uniref:Hypothetical_protein n=1 Tax=Hexamita inflata TaxID=28002 RepID=A0AA86TKM5_9EUKA|nr:Hypothetical protein HINF_LOCUS3408 [Hexamita inflata]